MKKMLVAIIGATFLMVGMAQTVSAARKIECKILASEHNTVIMDCGSKAGKLTVGTKVEVRKKKTAIEGC